MEIVGIVVILALCAISFYGVLHEVKQIKACIAKEDAQTKMYEEIRELLKRKG